MKSDIEIAQEAVMEPIVNVAAKVGIGEKIAMSNYHKILDRFENAIKESAKELQETGFDNAKDIIGDIFESEGLYVKSK